MLRVARIGDQTGRYYLTDLASELDVASVGAGPLAPREPRGGRWLGSAAAGLGLVGMVDADAFEAVLLGRHPCARHRLRLRETAVRAYDLTFAAAKSVSVLFALGGPTAAAVARAAHDEAVDAAMGYVSARAATVRCRPAEQAEGRVPMPVDGLVAAAFAHGVSRALDPHLHTHVVVANLARGGDGRWRAIDGRGLYAHAHAAGALYDTVLRHGISARLGLEWVPAAGRGWELSVVSPVLAAALSSRRAEILAHLAAYAPGPERAPVSASSRARRVSWAATREPKGRIPAAVELRRRWTAIARDVGCPPALGLGRPVRREARASVDEHRFAAAIWEIADRGVARRDVLGAWAASLAMGAPAEDVERCVDMLADWGDGTGVAERRLAPAAVVPQPCVLRLLGPRPAAPRALGIWEQAASAIVRYRTRWEVRDPRSVLGVDTSAELRALPARRLADHLATTRKVDDALAGLGRAREPLRDRGLELSRDLG